MGDADIAWLDAYDAARAAASSGAREPPTTMEERPDDAPADEPLPPPGSMWVAIDDTAPTALAPIPVPPMPHDPGKCDIKECPACWRAGNSPALVCKRTGERVFEPISVTSARFVANALLFVIGLAVRIVRGASEVCEPTSVERDELAEAIRLALRRRAGWVAEWDDLLMGAGAIMSYSRRAMTAPALPPGGAS